MSTSVYTGFCHFHTFAVAGKCCRLIWICRCVSRAAVKRAPSHFITLWFDKNFLCCFALFCVLCFCFSIWCCHTKWSAMHTLCIQHHSQRRKCHSQFILCIQSRSEASVFDYARYFYSFSLSHVTTGTRFHTFWPIAIIAKKCKFHWNNIVSGCDYRWPFHATPGAKGWKNEKTYLNRY